jgi:uncharacterized phage protein (TIGR01671 family)
MKEILFRGKCIADGKWVYGYYVPACFGRFPCRPAIVPEPNGEWRPIEVKPETIGQYIGNLCYDVDPSTVGQYTGLTDKNGKKIFEGDIVHYVYDGGKENGWKADQNSIIKWEFSGFYMDGIFGSNKYACCSGWLENIACNGGKFFEVIGNIHDNPELLGENK